MKSKNSFLEIGAPLNSEPLPALQWIEVASSFQIPGFVVVGLPSTEVGEARERVRAAVEASGFEFPRRRVVVNLSPAHVRKRGTGTDLGMALAILASEMEPGGIRTARYVAWGELGLNGQVKAAGKLTRSLYAAWENQVDEVLLSAEELTAAEEALDLIRRSGKCAGEGPRIVPVRTLKEAWDYLKSPNRKTLGLAASATSDSGKKIQDVEKNQVLMPISPALRRGLGIAAAGGHHLLLLGPRGTGKSHALEWLTSIQPKCMAETRLEQKFLEELHESSGEVRRIGVHVRPAALVGASYSTHFRPGEFSLAHGGLLIADEFPEWSRDSREALREPLERGRITLTRAQGTLDLPAAFTLAATGNLCPCGGWPPEFSMPIAVPGIKLPKRCQCKINLRRGYLARLSGPVLDRIDLLLLVQNAKAEPQPKGRISGIPSDDWKKLRDQVEETHHRAQRLWGKTTARLSGVEMERMDLQLPVAVSSLRARHKIFRVALTAALWEGREKPSQAHLLEAHTYRPERFDFWE